MSAQRTKRLQVELKGLLTSPPPGITCRVDDSNAEVVIARIDGPENSPFYGACFEVEISPTERYPYTPPSAKFITKVYHPNIDSQGRICLAGLKSKPSGSWNCTMNMATILGAIRILLAEPNLSDPLMAEIAAEYQDNYQLYFKKARESAMNSSVVSVPESMEQDCETASTAPTRRNPGVDSGSSTRLSSIKEKVPMVSPTRAPEEDSFNGGSPCKATPETSEVVTVESSDDADSLSPILNTSQRIMASTANARNVKRGLFSDNAKGSPKPLATKHAEPKPMTAIVPESSKQRAALRVDDFMFDNDSDEDDFFVPPKKQARLS